ncbi:MAG: malonyl-CoA decarboxylase [Acidithiobacillales bacterium]
MRIRLLDDLLGFLGRGTKPSEALPLLSEALLSGRGEASGVALAREILNAYSRLSPDERLGFLKLLGDRFGADRSRLEPAISAFRTRPGPETAAELHAASAPRRDELLRRLNHAPGGTLALVRMREDLVGRLASHPELSTLDGDFVRLFSSWFNPGFLELRRIDWTTPAHVLERIMRHEAVHEITSWDDLRRRLEPPDRRCFAFFHPALVDEPLIFVEVALADDIPEAISPLLADGRHPLEPSRATTAVFYSTSNCQEGLRGITFGHFLLKRVAEALRRDIPSLRTFVTLSPIPGFSRWLRKERDQAASRFLSTEEKRTLRLLDEPGWHERPQAAAALRPVLLSAVGRYLLLAKGETGRPVDAVARFHLGNGARLERVNFLGDASPKGLSQAEGFMANYVYDLALIERNHELYANRGEIVASIKVRKLLRPAPRKKG